MNDRDSPLGKQIVYTAHYSPELLYSIPRIEKRSEIGISSSLPFEGVDIWNAYELSWLDMKGKPQVALGVFTFPCTSPSIVESKSFKLYLNSFNQTRLGGVEEFIERATKDLSAAVGSRVEVKISRIGEEHPMLSAQMEGSSIDGLDIEIDYYHLTPELLQTTDDDVQEILHSDLLKSNCLVTGQPDWASVSIGYKGKKIDQEGLLKYLISFRSHNEFHEQCVERIFMDLLHYCQPEALTVYARYTRRGGLDINPFRTNCSASPTNTRLSRQ